MLIIGIIVSLFIFTFIVFVHELGHFSTARFFGVKVDEFGIGIPPRAKKLFRDKKGTLYSLNWLPIGGFVKLVGENPNSFLIYDNNGKKYNNQDLEKDLKAGKSVFDKSGVELPKSIQQEVLKKLIENSADYNLSNKPAWQQVIIILAGVFMNFLLAAIIFSFLFWFGVKPVGINSKIETNLDLKLIPTYQQAIESGLLNKSPGIKLFPVEESIASQAGLLENDVLTKVNNDTVTSIAQLQEAISKNKESIIIFEIIRDGETMIISLSPSVEGKIGSYLSENVSINSDFEYKYGFITSFKHGFTETYNQSLLTFKGLSILMKKIFNPEKPEHRQEALNQMSGPIGIVDFISSSIGAGVTFLLIITAIISINLGIFNLLPIPALDGGRFIFITINASVKKIFGRKAIGENFENYIHVGFFIVLIALSVLIAYNDIIKIISSN